MDHHQVPDFVIAALEKIAGIRDYDPGDHEDAANFTGNDGVWGTDEYLAYKALERLRDAGQSSRP